MEQGFTPIGFPNYAPDYAQSGYSAGRVFEGKVESGGSGGDGDVHPWKVTVAEHEPNELPYARLAEYGRITYYGRPTSTVPSFSGSSFIVDDDTILQIRVTTKAIGGDVSYALEAYTDQSGNNFADWSPYTVNQNGDVDFFYPIAEFYRRFDGLIYVRQLARSNLQTISGCFNGKIAKYITPI